MLAWARGLYYNNSRIMKLGVQSQLAGVDFNRAERDAVAQRKFRSRPESNYPAKSSRDKEIHLFCFSFAESQKWRRLVWWWTRSRSWQSKSGLNPRGPHGRRCESKGKQREEFVYILTKIKTNQAPIKSDTAQINHREIIDQLIELSHFIETLDTWGVLHFLLPISA